MNTFGATSPGPRPVAEMPANRTGGDAAEDHDDGGNPFGAVLGALKGAAAEAAPVSQPARPVRRREADNAEVAPVSDPLGMLAAAVAAPMPATVTPAAAESNGKTGPIAFETLVALAVPERPAGSRMEPDAAPAPEASLPGEAAIPVLAALPETILASDPSVPVDATVRAIPPSAIAALVQSLAPAQMLAPVEASPLAPGVVSPSAQPAASSAQARPRVTVLRQETHFAPVMPRSLGTLAVTPAMAAAVLPGQDLAATPVSLATPTPVPPPLPGIAPSPAPVAPVPGLAPAPVAAIAPPPVPVIEVPADPVAASRGDAASASVLPAANPSPAVAAAQPAAARPVTMPAPVTAPAIEAPADPVDAASRAALSGPTTPAPALPAANPSLAASIPQPVPAQPAVGAVPAPPSLTPTPLVPDAVAPILSEPAPAPQGAATAEASVAPHHTALGLAESGETGIAGHDAGPGGEASPGGAVPVPQPGAPLPASGLVTGAPSSAPVRQIAEAVAAEAARAGSAQPGALPGQPGSEGPLRILTLQLRPMDLGTVVVRMRLRGSQLEMSLHADHAETAELLRKDGALLSALLRDAGYHPDAVTIGAALAEPASGNASASGQGVPSDAGGQNPGREMSDQPARRQPGTGADRINDARERTNEANPAGPDRSGVYL